MLRAAVGGGEQPADRREIILLQSDDRGVNPRVFGGDVLGPAMILQLIQLKLFGKSELSSNSS